MNTEEHVREDIWESFPQKTAAAESSNHKYQTYLLGIIKKKNPAKLRNLRSVLFPSSYD